MFSFKKLSCGYDFLNIFALGLRARMAESVDALVSNTNGVTPVPVRPRLRVQKDDRVDRPFVFPFAGVADLDFFVSECILLIVGVFAKVGNGNGHKTAVCVPYLPK